MILSPDYPLLSIHPVNLLNIAMHRFDRTDFLFLEHFRYLVGKYSVLFPIVKEKHAAEFGDIIFMSATKYLWAKPHRFPLYELR